MRDPDYVVCPYDGCGHRHADGDEWLFPFASEREADSTPAETRCERCGRPFSAWMERATLFVSLPMDGAAPDPAAREIYEALRDLVAAINSTLVATVITRDFDAWNAVLRRADKALEEWENPAPKPEAPQEAKTDD